MRGRRGLIRTGIAVVVLIAGAVFAHHQLSDGSRTDQATLTWLQDSTAGAFVHTVTKDFDAWSANVHDSSQTSAQLLSKGAAICPRLQHDATADPPSLPPTQPLRTQWTDWLQAIGRFTSVCEALPNESGSRYVTSLYRLGNDVDSLAQDASHMATTETRLATRLGLHTCGSSFCS